MKRPRNNDDEGAEDSEELMSRPDTLQKEAFPLQSRMDVEGLVVDDVSAVYQYLQSVQNESQTVLQTVLKNSSSSKDETPVEASSEMSPILSPLELQVWEQEFMNDFMALKSQMDMEDLEPVQWTQPANIASWRKRVMEAGPPSFQVIYQFDHSTAMKLAVHFTSWLSATTNDNFSQWIYVLLLRIDNLLDSDDCHIIRSLGKKAVKLLETPKEYNDTALYTFRFIVLVVNKYYRQSDIRVRET